MSVLLGTGSVFAQDEFLCAGVDPEWDLSISGDEATFSFVAADVMDIPQKTRVSGSDYPRAMTLIGGRDTAIVIINARKCSNKEITDYPFTVDILTQKSETPVILTGCCTRP